ncbi:hypothetical protein R5W23_000742 [Gemmata sp. JC673]|uniref:Uncharacterized protein n=1 Tax=Gemmata algarum TaxID=2975278 RepID=A0ABU5ERQ3_9BACT|nr:hypothetical protein [Gemmata algarum]MDY3558022.1 hypothetical protein [Gemmata algarum]
MVVACQTPTRAEAGCGGHSGNPYALVEAEPVTAPQAEPAVPPAPKPCQGPNCSGAPVEKGLPVPQTTTPPVEVKDLVKGFCGPEPDGARHARDHDSTSPRPVRRAGAIFHPPRIG